MLFIRRKGRWLSFSLSLFFESWLIRFGHFLAPFLRWYSACQSIGYSMQPSDIFYIKSSSQAVLNRLHNEGLQVLSLSDLRYLQQQTTPRPNVQDGADLVLLQDSFCREKEALLDAIQALKDLVTQATAGQRVSTGCAKKGTPWINKIITNIYHKCCFKIICALVSIKCTLPHQIWPHTSFVIVYLVTI